MERIAWQVAPEIRVWCYYLIYWHVTRVTSCSLRSTNQHPDYFLHRGAHSSTHQNWSIYHSITHAHIIQLGLSPPKTFTREAWMELGKNLVVSSDRLDKVLSNLWADFLSIYWLGRAESSVLHNSDKSSQTDIMIVQVYSLLQTCVTSSDSWYD